MREDFRRLFAVVLVTVAVGVMAPVRQAMAHGDWGHVHVTGWAIENLPNGELRELFSDPEVASAALYGAAFPDAGYWPNESATREFAEYSHWEPFVQGFVEYLRANHPPPFETAESRKLVGFLLGCAAHGLQDEIFDSTFLFQVDERDDFGQDEADAGTDFFLYDDGHARFEVAEFVPYDALLELYADLPIEVSEETIRHGVETQNTTYLNRENYALFSDLFVDDSRARIPWTSRHYLDADVPGSLVAEIAPTMRYMEAIWERLHGRFDPSNLVVHAFPESPRRLRRHRADTVDGWVTLILGRAIAIGSAAGVLVDADGTTVGATFTGTRWGHPYPRLVRFMPERDLEPGAIYTARLLPGAALIGGGQTTTASDFSFQVSCTDPADPACPDLGPIAVPVIDGSFVPATETDDSSCAITPARHGAGWLLAPLLLSPLLRRRRRSRP